MHAGGLLAGRLDPFGVATAVTIRPVRRILGLQVETVHRPFSYLVPYSRFPVRVEVWDRDGNVVTPCRHLRSMPAGEP